MRHKFFTPEQVPQVISDYQSGHSLAALARKYQCGDSTIRLTLRRNGCSPRDRRAASRRIELDVKAFDKLTPASGYWIGFLITDGSITDRVLRVAVDVRDRGHLEKLKLFLQSGHNIEDRERRYKNKSGLRINSIIQIGSKDLVEALEGYGFTSNKTFTTSAPAKLRCDRDFWRGVVDGDGSVTLSGGHARIGVYGAQTLVAQFLVYARGIHSTKASVRPHGKISRVRISGRAALAIICKLYRDCEYALDRKALKAAMLLEKFGMAGT